LVTLFPCRSVALKKMRKSGFTLIELIIVIAIAGLTVGLGMAGWTRFRERALLNSAVDKLKSELHFVRSKAASGEKPVPEEDCPTLYGYQVSENDDNLISTALCGETAVGEQTEILINTAIGRTFVDFPVFFKSVSGAVDHSASVTLEYHGTTGIVNILESGEIE
jgi:prepilin-type N-terminal cleavage/methylation domain-containing protein